MYSYFFVNYLLKLIKILKDRPSVLVLIIQLNEISYLTRDRSRIAVLLLDIRRIEQIFIKSDIPCHDYFIDLGNPNIIYISSNISYKIPNISSRDYFELLPVSVSLTIFDY